MKYTLLGGVLYKRGGKDPLARIKAAAPGYVRQIDSCDGAKHLETRIQYIDSHMNAFDARNREYVAVCDGSVCALAHPDYAPGEDPKEQGWPVCRCPRVDRANVELGGCPMELTMRSSQVYILMSHGDLAMRIRHRGIAGGWDIDAREDLTPEVICCIFVFSRYMERENEFITV